MVNNLFSVYIYEDDGVIISTASTASKSNNRGNEEFSIALFVWCYALTLTITRNVYIHIEALEKNIPVHAFNSLFLQEQNF